ncbi:MAG TPA: universal stress protein [Bacillales bacterium]|nr:universal stress protein [Bacillales bacterium]
MVYQKVIVAFDGSEDSMNALRHGIAYVKENDAELTVVNVVKKIKDPDVKVVSRPGSTFVPGGNGIYQSSTETIHAQPEKVAADPRVHEEKLQAKGEEALKTARAELEKENIQAGTEVLEGDPAERIDQYAIAHEVDLIIVGHRGLSGLKKLVQGSVSQKVVEKASCPVLVVK